MHFKNLKVLTGTTLAVALSFVSAYPAFAEPGSASSQEMLISQATIDNNSYIGTVKSIVGDIVTLELADGSSREIGLNRMQRGALGLVPGMRLRVTRVDGRLDVALAPPVDVVVARVETRTPVRVETERRETRVEVTPPPVQTETEVAPVITQPVDISTPDYEPQRPIRALW